MRRVLSILAGLLLAARAAAAPPTPAPAAPEEHVRGDVVSLTGDALTVRTREGRTEALKLAPDARVTTVTRSSLERITPGAFIGTTAVPAGGGALRAVEVHVFPESMRGSGEGHRPWDLAVGGASAGGTGSAAPSSMTNGTVASASPEPGSAAAPSTMTNAKVASRTVSQGGLRLSLQYPGGMQTVDVPPGTPVVEIAPADRSRLAPGAHVFLGVVRAPDGARVVKRAVVGEAGVVPPM